MVWRSVLPTHILFFAGKVPEVITWGLAVISPSLSQQGTT